MISLQDPLPVPCDTVEVLGNCLTSVEIALAVMFAPVAIVVWAFVVAGAFELVYRRADR